MYYLAFFINYRPFLWEKIDNFLKASFSDVWFCEPQQKKQLQNLNELPDHAGYWYNHPWYLHGLPKKNTKSLFFPRLPIYTGYDYQTTTKDINFALSWLANHYSWSIFPWGGPKRFLSFVFLSTDQILVNQFINISSNQREIINSYRQYKSDNLFINYYNVPQNFSEVAQAILFSGAYQPAERIWNACHCNEQPPWIITNKFDPEIFSIFDWGSATYKFIKCLKSKAFENSPLEVYQPQDKESFKTMCKLSTQEPDTFIVIPQNTNLDHLEKLCLKLENRSNYSDLLYLNNILLTTEWFYGLNRDWIDYGDCLFVSKNHKHLQAINEDNFIDNYRLITYF